MSFAELRSLPSLRPSPLDLRGLRRTGALGLVVLSAVVSANTRAFAQAAPAPQASSKPVPDSKNSGSAPDDPGPLATDISPELKPKAIQAVIKKVASWQLKVAEPSFNRLWTYAAMYDGLLAASDATGGPTFRRRTVTLIPIVRFCLPPSISGRPERTHPALLTSH